MHSTRPTGKQIWAHAVQGGQPTNRGFNHWISKDGKDQRLIFSVDGYLQELNMKPGEPITSLVTRERSISARALIGIPLRLQKCKAAPRGASLKIC